MMRKISQFFNRPLFDSTHITKVHGVQAVLVLLVFVLSGIRVATRTPNVPATRSDTLGIVMLLTAHVARFHRWASTLANATLNSLEVVFWFVVVIVTLMGVSKYCSTTGCGLTWGIVLTATTLTQYPAALFKPCVLHKSVQERREVAVAVRKGIHKTVSVEYGGVEHGGNVAMALAEQIWLLEAFLRDELGYRCRKTLVYFRNSNDAAAALTPLLDAAAAPTPPLDAAVSWPDEPFGLTLDTPRVSEYTHPHPTVVQ
ncbi:hypothetical protein ARSEF4850_010036 [Beauveria asiatica]